MGVQQYNIERVRGDTSILTFAITTDGGTALNITGFSFKLTVDPSEAPTDALANLFQLTTGGGGIVIEDATGGIISATLSTLQADQTPGTYYYDLEQTDAGGLIRTLLKGAWTVVQDISK